MGRYTTTLQDPRIFWDHVLVGDGCWEFQGERSPAGYGRSKAAGKRWLAHRLAFFLWFGVDPGEQNVCHGCDNPSCVRPDHLWLGTQGENLKDAFAKGRKVSPQSLKTHCPAGHCYEGENLIIEKSGQRVCRHCKLDRQRARYWKDRLPQRGPYQRRPVN